MEYQIDINSERDEIVKLINSAVSGDTICCKRESQFEICKSVLVEAKLAGVTICLLDQDDYVIRQTSSKKRAQVNGPRLTDRQLVVIKALEKVLAHCRREGIALIGYSDELVALPASVAQSDPASAYAVEVDSSGCYRGAEGIDSSVLP
ncbi:response regulator [Marinobacterium sp. D7]|uniref:response regulator n=1 Tax=Marinobacterium ramblicola TaxID=2849041 RepID=UPI001C2D0202|nr:response regulator [Marinobacterium ramblicola]MBV1789927.1 response regulator [Marinobacterium ramblicola]